MKGINTYRKIAGKILRKMDKPVTKPSLYKLSHILNKIEKEMHTGPDVITGHLTPDQMVKWFVEDNKQNAIDIINSL